MTDTPAPAAKLPVTLLTGFLGAGKTTLLNALLRHPQMSGTGVVINEYGAVGIDHHLVEAAPEDTQLIDNGCMCCTARGEIAGAMLNMLERSRQPGMPKIHRIVIETTGLAEPSPILLQLLRSEELSAAFELDSVVTVVDGLNGLSTLEDQDIAVQQITAADRLLISKSDLTTLEAIDALRAQLQAMNPDASINLVQQGAVQPEQLFTGGEHNPNSPRYRIGGWFGNAENLRFTPVPQANLMQRADVPNAPADQDIQTFSLILDEPLPPGRFYGWIEFLRALCGPTLLRVKGLIAVEGQAGPTVIHGVQKAFHPPVELPQWPDADHRTRVVFITRGWGKDVVAGALNFLNAK